jgi:hypothetical protein
MIQSMVDDGYVVFVPYLRGVQDLTFTQPSGGDDPEHGGFWNTGTSITDYVDAQVPSNTDSRALYTLSYMEQEVDDIQAALTFLKARDGTDGKLVDPGKIALMGHSYGGARVVIAAASGLSPGPAVAVDMSGAVLEWANSGWWSFYIGLFAGSHEMPLRIFQAINEGPSDATNVPFNAASGSGTGGAEGQIYNPGPDTSTCDLTVEGSLRACAHQRFVKLSSQVARWWPDVHSFLVRHGVN